MRTQKKLSTSLNLTKNKKFKPGFTLMELLVVMVILGILVAIGLGNFFTSRTKAFDSQRKQDLQNVTKALELYYNDKGEYPESNNGLIMVDATSISWGDTFNDPSHPDTVYMTHLPTDPHGYVYYYEAVGSPPQSYALYAYLENEHDEDREETGYSGTDCLAGADTELCNFQITSSNY
jgi:type II secretion system protein G